MKWVIFMLVFLLVHSLAFATIYSFQDSNGTQLEDNGVWVLYEHYNEFKYMNGSLLNVNTGSDMPVAFILDNVLTPGRDYAAISTTELVNNNLIFAHPVGTVRGVVKDRFDNVVPDAQIEFSCVGFPLIIKNMQTDKFGYYSAELPVGSCRINTAVSEQTGFSDVQVDQGAVHAIDVKLNLTQVEISSGPQFTDYLVIIFIGIVIFVVLVVFILDKRPEPAKKANVPDTQLTQRERDLIRTLNAREKEIMKCLIEKKELTQTQLQHESGIPKASLSRILQKLHSKSFVEVEEYGKIRKIRLSSWFLEEKQSEH